MAVGTIVHGRSSYENVLCLGPHPRRGRPQDEQAPGQHPRADPADGRARRRRAALVHGRERLAVAAAAGRPRRPAGHRPQDAAHLLEHRVVPHAVRQRQRLAPAAGPWPDDRGAPAARPVGGVRGAPAGARRDRGLRGVRHASGPAGCSPTYVDDLSNWYVRRSRRRFWDGDPAALATLHECLYVADPAAGADHAVRDRAGLAGRRPPGLAGAARVGAPGARGRRSTARWSTTSWPRRWRWSAGWSSSAGRRGPSRRCATASRSAGRSSAPPAGPSCRTSCSRQVADELNVLGVRGAGRRAGRPQRQGQLPGAGQAVRQGHPAVAAAVAAADAGDARGRAARRRARRR